MMSYLYLVSTTVIPEEPNILMMKMRTKEQKQSDLASRIEKLQKKRVEIEQEIEAVKKEGELAPDSSWIVRYQARGKGGTYWYYKWQSKHAIFVTKNGQTSCHKYIGKAGSEDFLKAVEMMVRRTKIEALQQVQHTLDLGLTDLIEETTRMNKNKG